MCDGGQERLYPVLVCFLATIFLADEIVIDFLSNFVDSHKFSNADYEFQRLFCDRIREVLYRKTLVFLSRYRQAQNVERIKRQGNTVALGALHSRFQLPVEQVDENGLFAPSESVPKFFADLLISSVITILVFNIWLLGNLIDILVHCLQQNREHLLRVVLGETCELRGLLRHYFLDGPWSYVSVSAQKHLSYEVTESNGEPAPGSVLVFGVQMELMNVEKEVFRKGLSVGDALEYTVHKASITQVIQASKTALRRLAHHLDQFVTHQLPLFFLDLLVGLRHILEFLIIALLFRLTHTLVEPGLPEGKWIRNSTVIRESDFHEKCLIICDIDLLDQL